MTDSFDISRLQLSLERLALGELTTAEEAALRESIRAQGHDPDQLLTTLRASDEAILAAHSPQRAAAVIERRLADAKNKRRSAWWMAAPAVAATAVILLLIRSPGGPDDPSGESLPSLSELTSGAATAGAEEPTSDGIRLKGAESRLVLHRQLKGSDDQAERLREGQAVAEGDVLQVSYIAAGASHGVIVSIDGRGITTLHYPPPQDPPTSTRLTQGAAIPLSSAYELDDAPSFERFFFVTSEGPAPLNAEVVTRAAESLAASPKAARSAPLALPPELSQRAFLLEKQSPPREKVGAPQ